MDRLSELRQKLAKQQTVVDDLTAQGARSTGDETSRLMRKQEQAARTAQAIQHDLDAALNRVAYLRQAVLLAQENLLVISRRIAEIQLADPANTGGMEGSRASQQREIDEMQREIVKLGAPVTVK